MLVSLTLSLPSCEMNLRVQGAITIYEGPLLLKIGCGLDSRQALTRDKVEILTV